MKLFQILLPLYSNEKELFPADLYKAVREELTESFGGITTYTRSPATGLWKENEEKTVRDDIVIYEVMAADIDKGWWTNYKVKLEQVFAQDTIIIRVLSIDVI